jgi:hypothetical protein
MIYFTDALCHLACLHATFSYVERLFPVSFYDLLDTAWCHAVWNKPLVQTGVADELVFGDMFGHEMAWDGSDAIPVSYKTTETT